MRKIIIGLTAAVLVSAGAWVGCSQAADEAAPAAAPAAPAAGDAAASSAAPNYWSGGFVAELGLTDRIQAMTRQRSSDVLIIPPKGGIGPTTTSCFTRW